MKNCNIRIKRVLIVSKISYEKYLFICHIINIIYEFWKIRIPSINIILDYHILYIVIKYDRFFRIVYIIFPVLYKINILLNNVDNSVIRTIKWTIPLLFNLSLNPLSKLSSNTEPDLQNYI